MVEHRKFIMCSVYVFLDILLSSLWNIFKKIPLWNNTSHSLSLCYTLLISSRSLDLVLLISSRSLDPCSPSIQRKGRQRCRGKQAFGTSSVWLWFPNYMICTSDLKFTCLLKIQKCSLLWRAFTRKSNIILLNYHTGSIKT